MWTRTEHKSDNYARKKNLPLVIAAYAIKAGFDWLRGSIWRIAGAVLVVILLLNWLGDGYTLDPDYSQTGIASYYARSLQGNKTASGEIYRNSKLTAAHRTLPLGTEVVVRNLENDETVKVRINDRGPHAKKRIIDLSYAAAKRIGLVEAGVAEVRIRKVE